MILIIDLGSQFTKIICRNIEYLGYVYQCLEVNELQDDYDFNKIKALIISGGDNSIDNINYSFLTKSLELNIPILGICLGYQMISHYFGGKLENNSKADFGMTEIFINKDRYSKLLDGIDKKSFKVVMSHRDSVTEIPENFDIICTDSSNHPVMIENNNIFAMQFHPEVSHSEYGDIILHNFIKFAGCEASDESESFLDKSLAEIKKTVGDHKVIAAVSGGVDSTVASKLVANAIGKQLHCIFVDTGLMRLNEAKMVMDSLHSFLPPDSVHIVYAGDIFLDALKGIDSPEEKRKIIGRIFIEILEREAKKINGVKFLLKVLFYLMLLSQERVADQVVLLNHIIMLADYQKI
ncbi:MAG: gamma-glutamyl-gamma-aminobutyrate hydrolase family protein [Candidatus Heimdallarchaeota archaeon]|nr:gamma-glutamyl-gamma-aminobutyrate hydrolase family protein [Candidatus Heimdallarchaeota archaeon]